MDSGLRTKINYHHAALQGLYFLGFAPLWSYGPVLLLRMGLSDSAVGTVTSLALLVPIVLQPLLSSLADRYARLTSRRLALALSLLSLMSGLIMWRWLHSVNVIAAGYAVGGTLLVTLSPFINTMVMAYFLRGVDINYGLGRGTGSAVYAAVVMIMGFLVEKHDPSLLVPVYCVGMAGTVLAFFFFRYPLPPAGPAEQRREDAPVLGVGAFLKKYPAFALLLLGGALLQGAHSAASTYMIHIAEKVGVGTGIMGTVMAISAFTELPAMSLFPKLHRRFSLRTLLRVCAAAFVVRCVVYLCADAAWMLYLCAFLQFFEMGIFLPATVYYVTERLDGANQGKGQGLIHVFSNGAGPALITFFSGLTMEKGGIGGALGLQVAVAAIGAAVVFLATSGKIDKERELL